MAILYALLLRLLPAQGDPSAVPPFLCYLARHQNEDGSWGQPPPGCGCPTSSALGWLPLVPDAVTRRRFAALTEGLGSDRPSERERAQTDFYRLGLPAVPLLQESCDHPDPEVRWRCREALAALRSGDRVVRGFLPEAAFPGTGDLDLRTTSLALLVFFGAGYSHLSRDQYPDPLDPSRIFHFGQAIKKGVRWILERQKEDGSFGASSVRINLFPALALSKAYGLTAAALLKDPAEAAVRFVGGLRVNNLSDSLWKELVLGSGLLSGFPVPEPPIQAFLGEGQGEKSAICAAAGVIAAARTKRSVKEAGARLIAFADEPWTPEERFFCMMAMNRAFGRGSAEWGEWERRHPSEWKRRLVGGPRCDHGSWADGGETFDTRLISTLFTALASEQYYGYACAVFSSH